jgi:glucose/arabinose dehydrogenase
MKTSRSVVRQALVALFLLSPARALGQRTLPPGPTLGEGPRIRASVVTRDLVRPWSLTFLPDGAMLVTELEGRLRLIENGTLEARPIEGVPEVDPRGASEDEGALLKLARAE